MFSSTSCGHPVGQSILDDDDLTLLIVAQVRTVSHCKVSGELFPKGDACSGVALATKKEGINREFLKSEKAAGLSLQLLPETFAEQRSRSENGKSPELILSCPTGTKNLFLGLPDMTLPPKTRPS